MKKIIALVCSVFSLMAFSQEAPKISKTKFSKEALSYQLSDINGKKIKFSEILKKHEGKIIVLDLWASWCQDCIKALPKSKELDQKNEDVDFIYFSLDKTMESWKKGLKKYNLEEKENYWFPEGWKNVFSNYIDLNWIPRFLVIDQTNSIAKYYAVSPDDPEIQKTIDNLMR